MSHPSWEEERQEYLRGKKWSPGQKVLLVLAILFAVAAFMSALEKFDPKPSPKIDVKTKHLKKTERTRSVFILLDE
jgi:hypothetical protein